MHFYTKKLALIFSFVFFTLVNSAFFFKRQNFHKIETKGKQQPIFFRSARLEKSVLEKKIQEHNFNYVISFLGPSNDQWYLDEKEITNKLNVNFYDFGFSDKSLPRKKQFEKFFTLLDEIKAKNAKALIHCKSGSDRTGLMATIIQMYLYGFSYQEAFDSSFNVYYGHLRNKFCPIEKMLIEYSKHENKMGIREWINKYYSKKDYKFD